MTNITNKRFGQLFKKYRLRSEIETLAEFGDLLAQGGIVYENSIFTRWQKGERVPSDRRVIIKMSEIFSTKGGIKSINEVNAILESLGMTYLKENEIKKLMINKDNLPIQLQSSLGGLIKDFRMQKNISQLDVTCALGWSDPARIESIELGKSSKPNRDFIDRICSIIGLNNFERNQILLAGNYLPTQEEIKNTRSKVKDILNSWKYPAVLLDFSWRIIDHNKPNIKMNKLSQELEEYLLEQNPTVLEIIFHPEFIANKSFNDEEKIGWKLWLSEVITHYKSMQQTRTKEQWYIDLLKRMMTNPLFVEIWSKSQLTDNSLIVTKHGTKIVIHPENVEKRLSLDFFIVPLKDDPRFEIEYYTPADNITFDYFNS